MSRVANMLITHGSAWKAEDTWWGLSQSPISVKTEQIRIEATDGEHDDHYRTLYSLLILRKDTNRAVDLQKSDHQLKPSSKKLIRVSDGRS